MFEKRIAKSILNMVGADANNIEVSRCASKFKLDKLSTKNKIMLGMIGVPLISIMEFRLFGQFQPTEEEY